MKTEINYAELDKLDLSEAHLELLHMIAFEYNEEELKLESGLKSEELLKMIGELYEKLEVTNLAGLIRVAYEQRLLLLW